jgi:hypothetical protein
MNPNILFLDIDGVLNNRKSMAREPFTTHFEGEVFLGQFDPACIERCNRIILEGKCDVVLSSTWRLNKRYDVTVRYFAKHGLHVDTFIGRTDRAFRIDSEGGRWSIRGDEIDWWLRERGDTRPFIILDDSSDMAPHMGRLIQPDGVKGLLDKDVDAALKMLGVL